MNDLCDTYDGPRAGCEGHRNDERHNDATYARAARQSRTAGPLLDRDRRYVALRFRETAAQCGGDRCPAPARQPALRASTGEVSGTDSRGRGGRSGAQDRRDALITAALLVEGPG